MARVFLPSQLQSYSGGLSRTEADGGTVSAVLDTLDGRWPGIRFRVIDEQGRIRKHMRVYVGQERVFDIGRIVDDSDEVLIFGALSGG
jgi:molybdopterin synthase sulfur carrier subunit